MDKLVQAWATSVLSGQVTRRLIALTRERVAMHTGRFSLAEQIFFAKRLSFLITAGIPLLECLHIIHGQTKDSRRARIYGAIIIDIENGQYLSTSLARHKNLFNDFTVNLIRVGETSGVLSQNLSYLVEELGKKRALKHKIVSALIYPLFITLATLGITGFLTVYIFPKIMPIFASLQVPLPLTTRILLAVSEYLQMWGVLTFIGIVIMVSAFLVARARIPQLRYRTDRILLALPLAGAIARSYVLANTLRTLGLMLKSGIPIATAMQLTAETTSSLPYRRALEEVARIVTEGERVSSGLSKYPLLFPELCVHLVSVGEATGNLTQTLLYLAESYEGEVDDLTKNLSSFIEPILMLIMGLLVGLIAVSVITPIYQLTQHLHAR